MTTVLFSMKAAFEADSGTPRFLITHTTAATLLNTMSTHFAESQNEHTLIAKSISVPSSIASHCAKHNAQQFLRKLRYVHAVVRPCTDTTEQLSMHDLTPVVFHTGDL